MKLIGFKVSEIKEVHEGIVLKFESRAVQFANRVDTVFTNIDEFQIIVVEENERYSIKNDCEIIRLATFVDITKLHFRVYVDSLASIETFWNLVINEVSEYKKGKEYFSEDITSLFTSLENMNKLNAINLQIDQLLDQRDFESLRKLVQ